LAKKKGLKNILVTNGYFSKESFDYISPYIDAMNIDLKSFSNDFYLKYCGAKLQPVLDTIKRAHEKGIWIEITTLIIPGLNDRERDIEKIASFIAGIDKNIPWHLTRFFPRYKMLDKKVTPRETLEKAYKTGKKYLNDIHVGNI
jgi:pyruvate formate lyase activating enzyme